MGPHKGGNVPVHVLYDRLVANTTEGSSCRPRNDVEGLVFKPELEGPALTNVLNLLCELSNMFSDAEHFRGFQ